MLTVALTMLLEMHEHASETSFAARVAIADLKLVAEVLLVDVVVFAVVLGILFARFTGAELDG